MYLYLVKKASDSLDNLFLKNTQIILMRTLLYGNSPAEEWNGCVYGYEKTTY